jgi:hypothetical protein
MRKSKEKNFLQKIYLNWKCKIWEQNLNISKLDNEYEFIRKQYTRS